MKKILFPTDFSEVANNAFIYALEFAKLFDSEIVLLHTFEIPMIDNQYFPENYKTIYESVELSQMDMFKDEIPKLRAIAENRKAGNIRLSHRLMDGSLTQNIKLAIDEEGIDFLVMGTAGASGWYDFFIGSNTSSVVTAVEIPVLSIPVEAKYSKIKTLGFTTRFREKDREALQQVIDVAKTANIKVKCLHVHEFNSDVSAETIQQWKKDFSSENIEFFIIESEDVFNAVLEFIDDEDIDVLSLLNYKRSFFTDLFTASLSQKFSNRSHIPILTLHSDAN